MAQLFLSLKAREGSTFYDTDLADWVATEFTRGLKTFIRGLTRSKQIWQI